MPTLRRTQITYNFFEKHRTKLEKSMQVFENVLPVEVMGS